MKSEDPGIDIFSNILREIENNNVPNNRYFEPIFGSMAETISVTQLNSRVKTLLGSSPAVNDIWVVGEISNLKRYDSGHYYFTLKDNGSEIRSVMFKFSRGRVDFEPTDNMKITAFGHVDLYVERGSYQFIVETMQRSGVGELYQEYEKLKKKLEAEGLFDRSKKKELPLYPKTIGVVTSPTGAVIHDIITTSGRLFPANILLAPAKVQGDGSAASVVAGIELLNRQGVDVIIVGRGGGSLEDLWTFNEESVARAIAASQVPIISAVGHETDFTIADMVADVRAPTPTGAAELALRDKYEVNKSLDSDMIRVNRSLSSILERMHSSFRVLDSKLSPKRAAEKVMMHSLYLDRLSTRLGASLKGTTDGMSKRFDMVKERPESAVIRMIESHTRTIDAFTGRMDSLNPYNVLGRGYSFVADSTGKAITTVSGLKSDDKITIRMRDGKAGARIEEVEKDE